MDTNNPAIPGNEFPVESNTPKKAVKHKTLVSKRTQDLIAVANSLVEKLDTKIYATRLFNMETFSKTVEELKTAEYSRQSLVGARPEMTGELNDLDQIIDTNICQLKNMMEEKYTKKLAPLHFPKFMITKKRNGYLFPSRREERRSALEHVIETIEKEGLGERTYGTAFWTAISERYNSLMLETITADGTVSVSANTKNKLKEQLTSMINTYILIIKANNTAEDFPSTLRDLGIQKEKY